MNIQAPSIRPICSAVVGFLGVTLLSLAIGLADEMGVIESEVAKRAIGFAIGLMLVVVGNSLPKLRPLHSSRAKANSTASERLSGWALVLAGSAWIALFAFAPLNLARYVAAVIGISAVTLIAVNWTWLARPTFFVIRTENERAANPGAMSAEPRQYDRLPTVRILLCRHHCMRQISHRGKTPCGTSDFVDADLLRCFICRLVRGIGA